MVKADYKRDYYADLDLPNTADPEVIKKRFRELAKQYHPDRNPGREVDVVPKFQAIQAAHEILGDSLQKAKYDLERAKLNRPRDIESPTFRKPPPPPRRTDSGYANGAYPQPSSQPPRRDPSTSRYAPQNGTRSRPQPAASAGADKFAQFARAAPSWDRARFEEASRTEGLKGFSAMKGGQVPQTSPVRPRHPTAPRSSGADAYSPGAEPSPGFPGLNRTTNNQGRGFGTHAGAGDEPQSRSAYAQHYRSGRDRPPSAGLYPNLEPHAQQRPRESHSPLRQTRSFHHDDSAQARPELSRTSSRYATAGGERTQVNTANIGRSASVRNSPIDHKWEDTGPFGARPAAKDGTTPARHSSHDPQGRNRAATFTYASSETSSGEADTTPPTSTPQDRKKATLRKPHIHSSSGDAPGLTGYFPNTNYTRAGSDSNAYEYPAPETKATPVRNPFANTNYAINEQDVSANEPLFHTQSQDGALKDHSNQNVYTVPEQSEFSAQKWQEQFDNPDIFNPPEPAARDRKSPSKNIRMTRAGQGRPFISTKDGRRDAANSDVDVGIAAGVRHVEPEDVHTKAAAFRSGKLAPDFPDRVNVPRRGSQSTPASSSGSMPAGPDVKAARSHSDRPMPDEMDVDSPTVPDSDSSGSSVHVTVEEHHSPVSTSSNPAPRQQIPRHQSDTRANGFDLNDLKQAGPFVPSNAGLEDLKDISNNLPYQSRPADTLGVLDQDISATSRRLNLPRAPKTPHCPADNELNQDSWRQFGDSMTAYMHDWTRFNAAMIEHFRARQEAVTHGMYRNWVSAQGDGATAEDFEASHGSDKAGYATYMTWLKDDRICRTWWDVAFEEHRVCLEQLGEVRKKIKAMTARRG